MGPSLLSRPHGRPSTTPSSLDPVDANLLKTSISTESIFTPVRTWRRGEGRGRSGRALDAITVSSRSTHWGPRGRGEGEAEAGAVRPPARERLRGQGLGQTAPWVPTGVSVRLPVTPVASGTGGKVCCFQGRR